MRPDRSGLLQCCCCCTTSCGNQPAGLILKHVQRTWLETSGMRVRFIVPSLLQFCWHAELLSLLLLFNLHACSQVMLYNAAATLQVNLEHITAADLDSYAANLWLLAPPCQPYTRQGLQLGAQDARSRSFLHLLHIIASMQQHKQHPGGQQEQQWPEMLQTGTTPFGQRQQLVLGHGQATSHQGVMQSGVNGLQVIQEFAAC
eukprot:GHRR01037048.1.p1 GENE.GHRR01037048.1~~GHRR01037048.1.p1  ORF type:complete len:202 (+),score=63.77 GHRR01037048.1:281-886(+)